jgi:protein transport protein SEC61 subunit alpha
LIRKLSFILIDNSILVLSLIISICEAFAYIYSGMYGEVDKLGAGNAILILLQLTFAGIVCILLDEVLQKGYGLGSGISLFIATNSCENILWKCFSPITIRSEQGTEFEGALISLFHFLFTKPNKMGALYQAFYRTSAPNLNNLLATILVFFIVIYFQV